MHSFAVLKAIDELKSRSVKDQTDLMRFLGGVEEDLNRQSERLQQAVRPRFE